MTAKNNKEVFIDVWEVKKLDNQIRAMNAIPFSEIAWNDEGKVLLFNPEFLAQFESTGLNNLDFITNGYYLQGITGEMQQAEIGGQININRVKYLIARKNEINQAELSSVIWLEDGQRIEIDPAVTAYWMKTGLSNFDFITSGFYYLKAIDIEQRTQEA